MIEERRGRSEESNGKSAVLFARHAFSLIALLFSLLGSLTLTGCKPFINSTVDFQRQYVGTTSFKAAEWIDGLTMLNEPFKVIRTFRIEPGAAPQPMIQMDKERTPIGFTFSPTEAGRFTQQARVLIAFVPVKKLDIRGEGVLAINDGLALMNKPTPGNPDGDPRIQGDDGQVFGAVTAQPIRFNRPIDMGVMHPGDPPMVVAFDVVRVDHAPYPLRVSPRMVKGDQGFIVVSSPISGDFTLFNYGDRHELRLLFQPTTAGEFWDAVEARDLSGVERAGAVVKVKVT